MKPQTSGRVVGDVKKSAKVYHHEYTINITNQMTCMHLRSCRCQV